MRKLIAAIALALAAPTASAMCIGAPAERLTPFLKKQGLTLIEWETLTCGGGVDSTGQKIPKWSCFIQDWLEPIDMEDGTQRKIRTKYVYGKWNGAWVLGIVSWFNDEIKAWLDIPIEPCSSASKATTPEPQKQRL